MYALGIIHYLLNKLGINLYKKYKKLTYSFKLELINALFNNYNFF